MPAILGRAIGQVNALRPAPAEGVIGTAVERKRSQQFLAESPCEVAEPIDAEAKRQGAFLSVTTFVTQKPDSPWTHMHIFVLKDRAQFEKLAEALEAAGARLEPDEAKRNARADYAATLRDPAGQDVVEILK